MIKLFVNKIPKSQIIMLEGLSWNNNLDVL